MTRTNRKPHIRRTVKVYENNGGGLTLVILEDGKPMHAGTTDMPSTSLHDDIVAALADGELYSWGQWYDSTTNSQGDRKMERDEETNEDVLGGEITAADIYNDCERYVNEGNGGCTVIAEASSRTRIRIYSDSMGAAGTRWLTATQ